MEQQQLLAVTFQDLHEAIGPLQQVGDQQQARQHEAEPRRDEPLLRWQRGSGGGGLPGVHRFRSAPGGHGVGDFDQDHTG